MNPSLISLSSIDFTGRLKYSLKGRGLRAGLAQALLLINLLQSLGLISFCNRTKISTPKNLTFSLVTLVICFS